MKVAIFPGTFDPITHGHVDLIERIQPVFHRIVVAVAANPIKTPLFSLAERVHFAQEVLADLTSVTVQGFEGLLVDFAKQEGATIILRGLRGISDYDHEARLAAANQLLDPKLQTVLLLPDEKWKFVNSSLIREIASLGGDVSKLVHPTVEFALKKRFPVKG